MVKIIARKLQTSCTYNTEIWLTVLQKKPKTYSELRENKQHME